MRIGVVPSLGRIGGGVFQYSQAILQTLEAWSRAGCDHRFVAFESRPWGKTHRINSPELKSLSRKHWQIRPLEPGNPLDPLRELVGEGSPRRLWRRFRRGNLPVSPHLDDLPNPHVVTNFDTVQFQPDQQKWFRRQGLELMLYSSPSPQGFECGIPFIMPIHDIQHRLQPEFPEVSANGEWESREYVFRNDCRYATLLLADSEVGKEDILNCYGEFGVTEDRVKVLPYLPAYFDSGVSQQQRQEIRQRYQLPDRFLFYPAQFWPHKNHGRIIEALGLIKQRDNLEIPIVLGGSHSGTLREQTFQAAMQVAQESKIEHLVHYLGYIPDADMPTFYTEAAALVMPTFFGPTNIPILEAWAHGCPVLTSDIRGCRDQAGDAAVLVDPRSAESIAAGIRRLWLDTDFAQTLANRGHARLATYTAQDFQQRLTAIVEEAVERVQQGRIPTPPPFTGRSGSPLSTLNSQPTS